MWTRKVSQKKQVTALDISIILLVLALICVNGIVAQASLVGDSMYPTITSGQIAFYSRLPGPWIPENLTGQIIFVSWPEFGICHRCIADNGSFIQTKGDGLQDPESWVPKSQLRGVVFLTTSVWVSYLDAGVSALVCLYGYVHFRGKYEHEKPETKQNSVN